MKLIYIDPPYNTGNDSFKYNDKFNHSTWLTFMKNRLEVAKEFLREDGVIFINMDYNEVHYLKVLMDEIFGRENFQREIIWRMGFISGYKTMKEVIRNHDTILLYSKNYEKVKLNKIYIENKDFKAILPQSQENIKLFKNYGLSEKNIDEIFYAINHAMRGEKYSLEDTWNCNKWDDLDSVAIKNSVSLDEETILDENLVNFKGQKPEALMKRIIEISTQEGDLVMDFFAGSGTTCAVAHKMKRQWIGIEQMDYMQSITKERLKKVVNGEQGGVSKAVGWNGGGEFVYCELMPLNAIYKERILNLTCHFERSGVSKESKRDISAFAKPQYDKLESIYKELQEKAFLDYRIDLEEILKDKDFKDLSLEDKQKVLLSCLDSNMDYVLYSDIADSTYGISSEVIELNKAFYDEN